MTDSLSPTGEKGTKKRDLAQKTAHRVATAGCMGSRRVKREGLHCGFDLFRCCVCRIGGGVEHVLGDVAGQVHQL